MSHGTVSLSNHPGRGQEEQADALEEALRSVVNLFAGRAQR